MAAVTVKALDDIPERQTSAEDTDLLFIESGGVGAGITHKDYKNSIPGRVVDVQIFDTAGAATYTPHADAATTRFVMVGGGGAGGDADGDSDTLHAAGAGGGGAGSEITGEFTNAEASYSVSIAAEAVAANGNDTTMSGGTLNLVAPGGVKAPDALDSNTQTHVAGNGGGIPTTTGTIWAIPKLGEHGHGGFGIAPNDIAGGPAVLSGNGGSSQFGRGGKGRELNSVSSAIGNPGGPGAGGGGAATAGGVITAQGGSGGGGYLVCYGIS